MTLSYLNLGCGSRYHLDWINIDIAPSGPGVIARDLRQGIPLPDQSCEVVYHSHLLEHMRRAEALLFMRECYRVLRAGGILRVGVPDLEQICRLYLQKLESALAGDTVSACDYEWIMLEMYDQVVREQNWGNMRAFLCQDTLPNETFVYERIGAEARNTIRALKAQRQIQIALPEQAQTQKNKPSRSGGLLQRLPTWWAAARNWLLGQLLGPNNMRALQVGRFRLGGEVHHWMYDRYSLSRLMLTTNFRDPVVQSASQSRIPRWADFNLDTLPDDTVAKPDSLFVEAIR